MLPCANPPVSRANDYVRTFWARSARDRAVPADNREAPDVFLAKMTRCWGFRAAFSCLPFRGCHFQVSPTFRLLGADLMVRGGPSC